MAAPMARSLVGTIANRSSAGGALRRRLASSARHDDAQEAVKWDRITNFGIATCTVLAIYNLSQGPPTLPRSTGPDGLFEKKKHPEEHH